MAIIYSWAIPQLDCYPLHEGKENVVSTIHWRRTATNGAITVEAYGTQPVAFNAAASFTSYKNLTPAIVVSWLENAMGAEARALLDANLNQQLADIAAPSIVMPPLPWG